MTYVNCVSEAHGSGAFFTFSIEVTFYIEIIWALVLVSNQEDDECIAYI